MLFSALGGEDRKEFLLENLPGALENAFHCLRLFFFLSSAVSSVVKFRDFKKVIMQEFVRGEVLLSG